MLLFSKVDIVTVGLTNRAHINQINLVYTYYFCEKITKIKFIFAHIKEFPYICQKRNKRHYDTRIWSEELLLHQKRTEN